MGIVNPPDVQPGIMRALYRIFVGRGADFDASSAELVTLLAPSVIVDEGAEPQRPARLSIKDALAIGLLESVPDDGTRMRLGIPAPPDDSLPAAAEAFFIRELRRLVMAPRNNTDLLGDDTSAEEGAERDHNERLSTKFAREFTRIQAWLLMQDP